MKDKSYYLAFSSFSGIGPHRFARLLKEFGSAKNAWNADISEIKQILGEKTCQRFDDFRKGFDIPKFEKDLKKKKIDYVCLADREYSSLLSKIPNPPILLYLKGNKKLLSQTPVVAIVGTRKMTGYGRVVTERFAFELASSGFVIVSGMAIGVDSQAHIGCLDAGGKTIAVLGNGVDLPFPASNSRLYDKILKEKGLIISEFPPGEPPSKGTFPSRNRIIAGISQAVLVTEGAQDSGSLITANLALKFGRKVFAVPGPITSSLSAAPLRLIEKGAKLVVSPSDILKEFDVKPKNREKSEGPKFVNLTKDELKILEILENENLGFDEIARRLNIDPSKLGAILSFMEVKGLLKNSSGNYSLSV